MSAPRREAVHPAVAWVYRGAWAVIADLFKVPREGPTLPTAQGERCEQFHPAPGYLRYLKLWFWLGLVIFDGIVVAVWLVLFLSHPPAGILLAVPALLIAALPDVVVWVAIHLRYDNMWYVLSERSMRLRHGIWVISEVTITFENIQNVKVHSGPIQRLFGIADILVETAGAGAGRGEARPAVTNRGIIEGVGDAARIRDHILTRVRRSRTAGLGDEAHGEPPPGAGGWTPAHLAVLREIRDGLRAGGDHRADAAR